MKANASSCGTTAGCEPSCPATSPPIGPSTISLVLPSPPYLPWSKAMRLSASPSQSFLSPPASPYFSFISHHPLRAHDRAATAGTYLLANPPRQNGSSQWLQRGIRLAQKETARTISFEIAPRLQTASDGVQPLAASMTGRSLMVRDIAVIPFSIPSDIYIHHSIAAVSVKPKGGGTI